MRRRTIALAALAAVLATTLLLPRPAEASHWLFGGGFSIGGLQFRIGFRPGGHWDDYYYRVAYAVPSRHRCGSRCFVADRHTYHHHSCPVIYGHFRDHGFHERSVFGYYAPRYDRGHRYENRYHDRYDHDGRGWYDHRERYPSHRHRHHYHGRDRCYRNH